MKIKIREWSNLAIPKYEYTGNKNIFTLKITDKYKWLTLPVHSSKFNSISVEVIEIPLIQNYAVYRLMDTVSKTPLLGCQTKFSAPTYTFPSWDIDIEKTPGISFGLIKINEFIQLKAQLSQSPNSLIEPC